MTRLDRVLRPKSIAVLGAGWALNVIEQCRKMGFAGPVWPVHPTKGEIGGLRAYASLADLPGVPDAVFIGVNRFATIEVVRDLAAMGAGGGDLLCLGLDRGGGGWVAGRIGRGGGGDADPGAELLWGDQLSGWGFVVA